MITPIGVGRQVEVIAVNQEERHYRWGEVVNGVQIGIWASRSDLQGEAPDVELRVAVRNRSDDHRALGTDFTLHASDGGREFKHGSGPRSGQPQPIEPGGFREVLGWHLGPEELSPGQNTVWVVYHDLDGNQIRSGRLQIVVADS